jgi:ATP-dependent Zn protease
LALRPYVPLIVIGATNSPDSLDSALRRASRFDQEIAIGIPDVIQRKKYIKYIPLPFFYSLKFIQMH